MVCVFGAICEKGEHRALFLTVFAAAFAASNALGGMYGLVGNESTGWSYMYSIIDEIPFASVGAPPAYIIIMKICSAFSAEAWMPALVYACIRTAAALCAAALCSDKPYVCGAVLVSCFTPVFFAGAGPFTAALICMCASRYFRERRFVRYCTVIAAAACFDASALLLIPLYLIFLIPIPAAAAGAAAVTAALALLFPDACSVVFGIFGAGTAASCTVPVAVAAVAAAAAVIALIMYPMYKIRNGDPGRFVPVMCSGAVFSAAAIWDGRFFTPALCLLMVSMTALAPDTLAILKRFAQIVFPKKKKAAGMTVHVILALTVIAAGALLTFGNAFGAADYNVSLGLEALL